jgi:hypothetical protein
MSVGGRGGKSARSLPRLKEKQFSFQANILLTRFLDD